MKTSVLRVSPSLMFFLLLVNSGLKPLGVYHSSGAVGGCCSEKNACPGKWENQGRATCTPISGAGTGAEFVLTFPNIQAGDC